MEVVEFVSLMSANMHAVHGQREAELAIFDMGPPDGYGGETAIVLLSLVMTAKAVGIDPRT